MRQMENQILGLICIRPFKTKSTEFFCQKTSNLLPCDTALQALCGIEPTILLRNSGEFISATMV